MTEACDRCGEIFDEKDLHHYKTEEIGLEKVCNQCLTQNEREAWNELVNFLCPEEEQ